MSRYCVSTHVYKQLDEHEAQEFICYFTMLFIAICTVEKILSYGRYICEPSSCLVTGVDLYVDGKKLSPLTLAQQLEFAGYQRQMANYEKEMETYEELMAQGNVGLPSPQPPQRPSFCNVTVVHHNGCEIIGGKLYIGNNFIRNLTADEQRKVQNFIEQYEKYEMSRVQTLNEHTGSNGDTSGTMNSSNAALMDPLALKMLEDPNICTSI